MAAVIYPNTEISVIRRSSKKMKIVHASTRAKRLYIPTDVVNDSQYPLRTDIAVVSIIQMRHADGSVRRGLFIEEPPTVIDLY